MTVQAKGKHIRVTANENVVVDEDRACAEHGTIGFQGKVGNANVFFRNVRIRKLP